VAAEGDAQRDLARLAVAAAAFRDKEGRPPAAVEELAPKYVPLVPRDPFDGKPLRMVARDGVVIFYSVGPDQKDDGGKPRDDQNRTGDVTFTYAPPK
jgi:hypothetical protein